MVRNKVDPCMFCDEVHSGPCGGPVKKAAAPRKTAQPRKKAEPRPETVVVQNERFNPLAAMQAVAVPNQTLHAPAPEPEPDAPTDMEFCVAVAALDPILHPTEQRKYAAQIARGRDLTERRRAWQQRIGWTASPSGPSGSMPR